MPPANVEGKVEAHALSAVCQRRTVAFVVWSVDGSELEKLLVWESCADVGDGCHDVGRRRATVVNAGT